MKISKWIKKLQIKGFVVGVLVMVMLSGITVFATTRTETINVAFRNIRIVVNGVQITPRDGHGNIVEPFIWNGTTYLPVRAVAEVGARCVLGQCNINCVFREQHSAFNTITRFFFCTATNAYAYTRTNTTTSNNTYADSRTNTTTNTRPSIPCKPF